jgi:hypothetical protein
LIRVVRSKFMLFHGSSASRATISSVVVQLSGLLRRLLPQPKTGCINTISAEVAPCLLALALAPDVSLDVLRAAPHDLPGGSGVVRSGALVLALSLCARPPALPAAARPVTLFGLKPSC